MGRDDVGPKLQPLSADSQGIGERITEAKGIKGFPAKEVGELAKGTLEASEFAKEVEEAALRNGDSPELAKKKGEEAGAMYGSYLAGVAGGSKVAEKKAGPVAGSAVEVAGAVAGSYGVKPFIKRHVLGKTEADYNTPLFPGATPPGPG